MKKTSQKKFPTIIQGLLILLLVLGSSAYAETFPDKTAPLWQYTQWSVDKVSHSGNPFDIVAKVTFSHIQSGEKHITEMFYNGSDQWNFRFTATLLGKWTFTTESDNAGLNGHSGSISVEPNPNPNVAGFITHDGNKWIKSATAEAFVPQLLMYADPPAFYRNPDRIDADIKEFFTNHGFNGFHTSVLCRWFDFDKTNYDQIASDDPNPDPRVFEALELLITKTNAAGGFVHIWAWGDEQRKMTPIKWDINGKVDKRLQRYICARLGPVPGWSMGYGFDLQEWVQQKHLEPWHEYMQRHLGWKHLLGARAPGMEQIYDGLDYISYQQHRPDYNLYVKGLEQYPGKPIMFEDRFRVRLNVYPEKDYDPDMTRRGLWHSTMAGGAANIWGHLINPKPDGMSNPYPNKEQILTWSKFWNNRFKKDMVRNNNLTDGFCLTIPAKLYVFYKEDTTSIKMDLSNMTAPTPAVAVDTKSTYKEIPLGILKPGGSHVFEAPHKSDWAVSVK
jgi:hypothetical protein